MVPTEIEGNKVYQVHVMDQSSIFSDCKDKKFKRLNEVFPTKEKLETFVSLCSLKEITQKELTELTNPKRNWIN